MIVIKTNVNPKLLELSSVAERASKACSSFSRDNSHLLSFPILKVGLEQNVRSTNRRLKMPNCLMW